MADKELLIISFGSSRYGVWEDDVLAKHEIHRVHRLPMTPRLFSGISDIDGHTVNLFDLGACLGHEPCSREDAGRALVVARGKKLQAFLYGREESRMKVKPGSLVPMPPTLRIPEMDTCVLSRDGQVPIVNIQVLYKRLKKGKWEAPSYNLPDRPAAPRISFPDELRIFEIDGLPYAVPASQIEGDATMPGLIRDMLLAPPYVKGITGDNGRVSAVIDPNYHLQLPSNGLKRRMVHARNGHFGFLMDRDLGTLRRGEFELRPLPTIARTGLMGQTAVAGGELLPVINVSALLARYPLNFANVKYRTRSRFAASLGKTPSQIVQLSIHGIPHCLPGDEVEDVLDLLPFRELPGERSIMVGVAAYGEELLPVLDLALCYGWLSRPEPGWKMILVRNGNFRALVLAESVDDPMILPVESQRLLPITVPSRFVYGCYLDEEFVRLILNVAAITERTDRRSVAEQFRTLSRTLVTDHHLPTHQPVELAAEAGKPQGTDNTPSIEVSHDTELGSEEARHIGNEEVPEPDPGSGTEEKIHIQESQAPDVEEGEAAAKSGEAPGEVCTAQEESLGEAEVETQTQPLSIPTHPAGPVPPGTPPCEDILVTESEKQVSDVEVGLETSAYEPVPEPPDVHRETGPMPARDAAEYENESEHTVDLPAVISVTETPDTTWESVEDPSDPLAGQNAAPEATHQVEETPSQGTNPAEPGAKKFGEGDESEGRTEPETAGPDQVDIPEETIGSEARSVEPAPQSQTDPTHVEQEEDEGQITLRSVVKEELDTRELVTGAVPTQARLRDLRDKSAGEILKEGSLTKEPGAFRTTVQASRPVPSRGRVRRWATGAALLVLLLVGLLIGYRASGPEIPEIGEKDQMAVMQPKELKPENTPATVLTPSDDADFAPPKEVIELLEEISPAKKGEASAEAVQSPKSPPEEAGALPDTAAIREEASIPPTQTPTTVFLFYTVVKGDTLWDVSDRFTQSGFYYQTLAGDSGIEDPNLIEPGQIVWIRMDLIPPAMLSDKSLLDRPDAAGPASGQEQPDLLLEVDRESGAIIVKEVTGEIPFAHVRHLVVKGDTLWHIAERFTGDPFKYPVLAEASRIANPDLIFPRQTIFIRMASSP